MRKISIVLAESRAIVRQGVRALLEKDNAFSVVGETGDGLETVKMVERLRPDVLILDLMLPSLNGLDVAFLIREKTLATRVLFLTNYSNEAYVLEALRNGAYGYVLKDSPITELATAIRQVHSGRKFLGNPLSDISIKDYLVKSNASQLNKFEALTARQREVVNLVAEGKSSREIGRLLGISRRTVETHRSHAMKTFGINKQTDLVRFVLQKGIPLFDRSIPPSSGQNPPKPPRE
jgi:DNA-binding NarL/FixJ family response regulator